MALQGLDEIDWAGLEHAHGAAGDVPGLLRRIAEGGEGAAEALRDLDDRLHDRDGPVRSAATAALPFLTELAESGDGSVRAGVLSLLGRLNEEVGAVPVPYHDPGWPAALRRVLPRIVALLGDPDATVRRTLTSTLATAVDDADLLVPALCGRWAEEDDEAVRLGVVLAVGRLARGCTADVLPEALIWLRERCARGDAQIRMAASIALAGLVEAQPADLDAVTRAVSEPDVEVWRHFLGLSPLELAGWPPQPVGLFGGTAGRLFGWVEGRLGDDVVARTRLCTALAGHRDADRRSGALQAAAKLAAGWRSAAGALLPVLAEHTADEEVTARLHAAHVLAAMGPEAGSHTEALAARLDDEQRPYPDSDWRIGDIAAWGLAWRGDPRCLPRLVERLGAPDLGYGVDSTHGSDGIAYSTFLPGVQDVLGPLRGHADALLPVIRDRLRGAPGRPWYHRVHSALAAALEAWGEAAAPAVPELVDLLATDARVPAAKALAAMGPAARDAVPVIEEMMRPRGWGGGFADRMWLVILRWAFWKITGDPGPAVSIVDAEIGHLPELWPYVADLGPHAAHHEGRLRLALDSRNERERITAAYALCRVTGGRAAPWTLSGEVGRLATGEYHPARWAAVRYLAELGAAPAGVARDLRKILDADGRHRTDGGWRNFSQDRELRELAAGLLASAER